MAGDNETGLIKRLEKMEKVLLERLAELRRELEDVGDRLRRLAITAKATSKTLDEALEDAEDDEDDEEEEGEEDEE